MDEAPKPRKDFRGIVGWQEAIVLVELVETACKTIHGPAASRLIEQLVTAADSIHSNIAEGYAKGLCPDYLRFLKIAHGSACEVETRIEGLIARRRIDLELGRKVVVQTQRVRALIWGLIKYVQRRLDDMAA